MNISVVIPTFRRPSDLCRCLEALIEQTRRPDEVLVIVRDSDTETQMFFQQFDLSRLPLRLITVTASGQVAALNAGLMASTGEIIAFTDDDAAPHPDWIQRIISHFVADPLLGGIGGRDWQPIERGEQRIVGKVQWFGRVIGNHHLGVGDSREVDVIKGANMSYRRNAITGLRFDERLLGTGAQVHNDMAFSLALKKAGGKIIYDPNVAIDHYPAQRYDEDTNLRGIFNAEGIQNSAYNQMLVLLSYLSPLHQMAFLFWAFMIGTRSEPGLAQVPRLIALKDRNVRERIKASYAGRFAGVVASLRIGRPVHGDIK